MITIKSLTKKTILLITLTTLTITLGTSLSWEHPSDGDEFKNNFDLNVSNSTDSGDVEFWSNGPNSDSYSSLGSNSLSSGFAVYTFNTGSGDTGEWEYRANSSSDEIDLSVTIDREEPNVPFDDIPDFVSDNPTVTVTVEDIHSGVDYVSASADNSVDASVDDNDCDGSESCDLDIDLDTSDDSLEQGDQFQIDVSFNDTVGNSGSDSTDSITFDSEWGGSDSADLEWENGDGTTLDADDSDDQDLSVDFTPDSGSQTSLTCSWDGGEDTVSDIDTSDESVTESCSIDYGDVGGSRFDLTVSAEDEAVNSEDLVVDEELVWDVSDPSISDLSQPEGLSTFNSGFSMEVEGSDDASGIETLEYYLNEDTSVGEGNSIDFGDSGSLSFDKGFDVDTGDLGQGNHTVYVRVEDKVGNTNVETFDFEYFPDRSPDIGLNGSSEFRVTSGDTGSYSFSIRNDSPFFVEQVEVSGEGLWNGTVSALNLESGESKEKMAEIDATKLNPDSYSLTLASENYDISKSVDVVVEANDNQASNINSSVDDWMEKADKLEKNASILPTVENDNENLTAFEGRVQEAQSDIQSGNYYLAKQKLEDLSSSYQEASNTIDAAVEQHETNKRNQLIIIGVILVVLIIILAVVVYREYYDESGGFELDLEGLKNSIPDLNGNDWLESLRGKVEKMKEESGSEGGEKDVSFNSQNDDVESNDEDGDDEDDFEYHYKDS